ncbi:MAG: B12-binding domain-containing radical SAM protein [Gammaproteobacteria bacterium]|nr:B12-binding domain-containing radical SAM protein [Gammaproteobacteria bacterium]
MSTIVIASLNARYIHASLGARYLLANMAELRDETRLIEHDINTSLADVAEGLLRDKPRIIGLGVYVWNASEARELVQIIKTVSPETVVVLGGPEVSYEIDDQEICKLADYVIPGQGDLAFAGLCRLILKGDLPQDKVYRPSAFSLSDIALPYDEYTGEDIARRVIYVEASRGCPFRCEFCLSSLDKTVYPFDLDRFLGEIQKLYDRGVRSFKFIDRTFNLKTATSIRIMEFFLDKMREEPVYVHFELVPDKLPDELKAVISRFPEHSIQFEIGIQSFNPDVQALISRKQDNKKSEANLRWIRNETNAHIHADLIVGLPGEDVTSLANGFNRLVALNPHEIQVGVLKRLRGTPIIRHTRDFGMRYSPLAPYTILSNELIDFATMQRLKRFARYWDMIGNSGRFKHSRTLLLGSNPFERFLDFSDWLHARCGRTHGIALERLFGFVYQAMTGNFGIAPAEAEAVLMQDYLASGLRSEPRFMYDMAHKHEHSNDVGKRPTETRQRRHS